MWSRLPRLVLAVLLLALMLIPADAGAQDSEINFPPVSDGKWEGLVNFSGFYSSDNKDPDGSWSISIFDVIDDTAISLEFTIDAKGRITNGTMDVDLTWFSETVGATPINLDSFRVRSDHHQTGRLKLSGNATQIVASGTLTYTKNIVADGNRVDEISGTENEEVEWVFGTIEATCVRVTAELVAASGISFMGTTRAPRETVSEGKETHNELVSQLLAWPASVKDPQAIKDALEQVTLLANEVHDREFPQAEHLLELVNVWRDLNAKLAQLDECQTALVGWVPESARTWLDTVLRLAIDKAIENQDTYDAQELIDIWDAGMEVQVMNGELLIGLLDAFHAKLNEAITDGDTATIIDILAFASAYGYPNLYAKAKGAL